MPGQKGAMFCESMVRLSYIHSSTQALYLAVCQGWALVGSCLAAQLLAGPQPVGLATLQDHSQALQGGQIAVHVAASQSLGQLGQTHSAVLGLHQAVRQARFYHPLKLSASGTT